jgi:hypothetical protein
MADKILKGTKPATRAKILTLEKNGNSRSTLAVGGLCHLFFIHLVQIEIFIFFNWRRRRHHRGRRVIVAGIRLPFASTIVLIGQGRHSSATSHPPALRPDGSREYDFTSRRKSGGWRWNHGPLYIEPVCRLGQARVFVATAASKSPHSNQPEA